MVLEPNSSRPGRGTASGRPTGGGGRAVGLLWVLSIMVAILGLAAVSVHHMASRQLPLNVVLVVLDTVRRDHLELHGHERPTAPRLARLAAESLVFENARAAAPWTLPSHASLFTGLYPSQHGCHWEHRYLVDSAETIAEVLQREEGFETFGVTTNANASSLYHLDQGFEQFLEVWNLRDSHPGLDDSAIANREVRRWLDLHDARSPFFLFVNYSDAHLPYDPPPPYDRMFGPVSDAARRAAADPNLLHRVLAQEIEVTPELAAGLAALYDGEIRKLDDRLGELLDLLEEKGLREHTFLVITSDHGEHLGEHGLVDHQLSLSEELLRVPLLVYYPEKVRPGRIHEPVSLTQVAWWIQSAARGEAPEWTAPPDRRPPGLMAEAFRPVGVVEFGRERGLDVSEWDLEKTALYPLGGPPWKYVQDSRGRESLFLLEGNEELPCESTGEARDCAGEMARCREILARHASRFPLGHGPDDLARSRAPAAEDVQELRALGYPAAAGGGTLGVHAAEHWSAALRRAAENQLHEALEEFALAQDLAPEHPGILWDAASTADRAGRPEALDLYQRYLRLGPSAAADPVREKQARERIEALRRSGN